MHKKGDDVPFKLLGWYRDAEIGDSEKQWMLAGRYRTGDGVVKSAADALSWLQQSAERGYFLAQWELGAGYVEGDFVPKILRWLICG